MNKKWNPDRHGQFVRCGHPWCSRCRKKKGWNYGNRRVRHYVKVQLRKFKQEEL